MFAYNLCYLLSFLYSWFILGNRYFVWFDYNLPSFHLKLVLFHCVTILLLFLFFAEASGGGGAGDLGGGVPSCPVCCASLGFLVIHKVCVNV